MSVSAITILTTAFQESVIVDEIFTSNQTKYCRASLESPNENITLLFIANCDIETKEKYAHSVFQPINFTRTDPRASNGMFEIHRGSNKSSLESLLFSPFIVVVIGASLIIGHLIHKIREPKKEW